MQELGVGSDQQKPKCLQAV